MNKHFLIYKPHWRNELRAVLATARKDWLIYWRYPLNAVSSIIQPVIWLAPAIFMGYAFSVKGQAQGLAAYSGSGDYVSFFLLGTILSNFISSVFWGMGYSLKSEMDSGVLEANWLAPASRPLMLMARTLTSLALTAVESTAILLIAGLLFGFRVQGHVLAALGSVLPMLIGLYGFGFAFAALVLVLREANAMVDISSFLVQTFSGSNFPIQALPRWLLPVSLAIPLTYGIDAFRGWLLGTHTLLPIAWEIVLLLVFMALMLLIGLWAFNRLERRVRRLGTLGQY
jgi:ABC-2 type transport system permease protein